MQVPRRRSERSRQENIDPYISVKKAKELQEKLKRLEEYRTKLAAEVKHLALDGDFSENAPYQLAKSRLRGLNRRMMLIKKQLESAVIIPPSVNKEKVDIGSTVEIQYEETIKRYTILGSAETNPSQGIISYHSPLGSRLLNKKVGDTIKINKQGKEVEYVIIKIY